MFVYTILFPWQPALAKEKISSVYNDVYWERRYTIRLARCPVFLTEVRAVCMCMYVCMYACIFVRVFCTIVCVVLVLVSLCFVV